METRAYCGVCVLLGNASLGALPRQQANDLKTSISTMHAVPDSDYRPLLDLCNDSNDSAGFVLTWEDYSAIYENITELFVNRKDLFCVLYALNRTLPNVWDDLEFHRIAKPRHIPRVLDSIDEVIIVLRIAKVTASTVPLHV